MAKFKSFEGFSTNLAPSAYMIEKFFTDQLGYCEGIGHFENNILSVKFTRTLSQKDLPVKPDVSGITCVSVIEVNMLSGRIMDHYFRINKGTPVRIYQESYFVKGSTLDLLLKYHFNLVHMSREYIAGGWLYRKKIDEQLQHNRERFQFITSENAAHGLLDRAKPEELKK